MRSLRAALLLAGVLIALPASSQSPTPEQVREAIEAVYNDPDLHGLKAERTLRFKRNDDRKPAEPPPDMDWLKSLVAWIAQAGRWLVWLAGAALFAVLLIYLRRWMAVRGDALRGRTAPLPSHVRDLDIRPESLPDDVAAAVRALWQRGQARDALSLLYRGALSRLVHDHGVPVRSASTEGECVRLASRQLGADGSAFFERLVVLWQLAVYGARLPEADAVLAVCDQFDARLPRKPVQAAA